MKKKSIPTRSTVLPLEMSQRQLLEEVGRRFGAEFQILDTEFRPVSQQSPCEACDAIAKAGESCCLLSKSPPAQGEPCSFMCPQGIGKAAAAVYYCRKPIAYLVATKSLRDGMKTRLSTTALSFAALYESRRLIEVQQKAHAAILWATTPAEVWAATHSALRDLLGEMNAVLYVRRESGVFAVDRSISEISSPKQVSLQDDNVVAWVGNMAVTKHFSDLSESPPPGSRFMQNDPDRGYRSVVTMPVLFASSAPGAVVQCASLFPHSFSEAAIQSAEVVLAIAGIKMHLIRTSQQSRLTALREALSKTWQDKIWQILIDAGETPEKVLAQKSALYQAFADEARRLADGYASSVRLLNARHQLRFVACSGDHWTDALKRIVYTEKPSSAGMSAVISDAPVYIDNALTQQGHYVPIFPAVKSIYAIPFHVSGKPTGVLSVDKEIVTGFGQDLQDQLCTLIVQFEKVLQLLMEIEQAQFQSLETRLAGSFDVAAFCSEAKQIVCQLMDASDCEIFIRDNDSSSLLPETPVIKEREQGPAWSNIIFLSEQALKEGTPISQAVTILMEAPSRDDTPRQIFITCAPFERSSYGGVIAVWRENDDSTSGAEEETTLDQIASWLSGALTPLMCIRDATKEAAVPKMLFLSENVQSVASVLAEKILSAERAGSVHIRLLSADSGELQLVGATGLYSKFLLATRYLKEGISGFILDSRAPYWAENVQDDTRWREVLAWVQDKYGVEAAEWIKSSCGLPLTLQGRFVGTLIVNWRNRKSFSEKERVRLEALAADVATHIGAVQQLENLLKGLQKVREHVLRFLKAQDTDKVLDLVLEAALELSQQQYGSIRTYSPRTNDWILRHRPAIKDLHPDNVTDNPVYQRTVKKGRTWASKNLLEDEVWQEVVAKIPDDRVEYRQYLRSQGALVQVPVRQDDGVIHILTLYHSHPRDFTGDTLELLDIMASFAAIAIRNAEILRLHEPFALMGQMLGGFLHVIGNDINDMSAVVEMIADPFAPKEDFPGELAILRQCISRLRSTCRDLTRASTTETTMSEPVSLKKTAEIALADFTTFAAASGINVEKELASTDSIIRGNDGQIEIAFRMVAQNALEALKDLPEGRERRLTVSSGLTDHSEAFVRFTDTGPGMDAGTVARCRLPFFSTKFHRGGSGLGLAVANGIVLRHGGRLEIESQVGVGSAFTFVFVKEE